MSAARWVENEPTFRCGQCMDSGFVMVDEESNSVKPCPRCKREQHDHWAMGGYRPSSEGGHALSERREQRRTDR